MSDVFCAQAARDSKESLWGTAVAHTTLWIAIEVRQPWGRKALEDSELPAPVKQGLLDLCKAHAGLRVQFIRQPERTGDGAPMLYAARTSFGRQALWKIPLAHMDEVTSINWDGWARGAVQWDAWRVNEPLYLVCVHGRRDRCCAVRGMPVYNALHERAPSRVWQTSHLGGHRFAATLLSLPDGLSYGRVEEAEAGALFDAREQGRLFNVERLRGRTALASPAQAAECAIRSFSGREELGDYRLEEISEDDAGVMQLVMVDEQGQRHRASLGRVDLPPGPVSCGAEPTIGMHYVSHGVEALGE